MERARLSRPFTRKDTRFPTTFDQRTDRVITLSTILSRPSRKQRTEEEDTAIRGFTVLRKPCCIHAQRGKDPKLTALLVKALGACRNTGTKAEKKKKRKEKRRKIGKKIDGGASEIIEWSTLRWSSRFSRCWQQWRAKQRGADKKVIDTDTNTMNLKISWILIS